MSFIKNSLPVKTVDGDVLYFARIETVPRLIESGRVRPVGSRHRVRSLVAICGTDELLRADRPPVGARFSDNREAHDNPRGVWRFKRNSYAA